MKSAHLFTWLLLVLLFAAFLVSLLYFEFDKPRFLVLLFGVPVLWALSFNSLAGLGWFRRFLALFLRTAVFSLLV